MKIAILLGIPPRDYLNQLQADEMAAVTDLASRDDTATLIVTDGNRLMGYAVFGQDNADMVTIYAARSLDSFVARAALTGLFGAAQVLGQPLRVHTSKLRAMARFMGAGQAIAALDGDGVPMGVFGHGV